MPVRWSDEDPAEFDEEAFKIVDDVIAKAVHDVSVEIRHNLANLPIIFEDKEDFGIPNIEWSSCENFTPENGVGQIEKFIATWKRDSAWLYCIDYMGDTEFDYDIRHKYRVRWSIPTRRKPIPRATACVYFTISLSKIKPKTLPVEVFYIFEGNRLVHKPGKSRFREIWLKNLVESKILMMETVTF
ncbi:A-kinase anchor protein 14-like [Styela clava]